jgi:hypothetical protein
VIARARNWRRPLTFLPRAWRLTEREETTLDVLCGRASRRLKVEANFLKYAQSARLGDPEQADRLAVVRETIAILDSVRQRR